MGCVEILPMKPKGLDKDFCALYQASAGGASQFSPTRRVRAVLAARNKKGWANERSKIERRRCGTPCRMTPGISVRLRGFQPRQKMLLRLKHEDLTSPLTQCPVP